MKEKTYNIIRFIITILLFMYGYIFQYIPVIIFNISSKTLENNATVAIIVKLFSYLMEILILVYMYRNDLAKEFKTFKKNKYKFLEIGFKLWIIGLIIMGISNTLISQVNTSLAPNEALVREKILNFPIFMLFNTAIIAPFIEEMTFRKSFRTVIKNDLLYVLLSGIIFGSMHVLTQEVDNTLNLLYLIPYCSLGVILSYMYKKTNSIYVPIIFHMIHNFIITMGVIILQVGMIVW